MSDGVFVDRVGSRVAVVTVDRPPANSLDHAARLRLSDVWAELGEDDAVGAVVVTGAGDRFFSAGLDMVELARWHRELRADERRSRIDLLRWSPLDAGLVKPVIAAVNGFCLAGGLYLAAMCDVRVAAAGAQFGIPEVRWAHPAVFSWLLARQMPLALVMEMVLWADRRFTAERMYAAGFVNQVVPDRDVVATAVEWAEQVAALPAGAVGQHKRMLSRAAYPDADRARLDAETALASLHSDPMAGDLVASFLASRTRREKGDGGPPQADARGPGEQP